MFQRRRVLFPLALLVLVLLALATVRSVMASRPLAQDVEALQELVRGDPYDMLQPERLRELNTLLAQTDQDLQSFVSTLGPAIYLAPLFGWVPRYGGDLANASALADVAHHGLVSAQATVAVGLALGDALESSTSRSAPPAEIISTVSRAQSASIQEASRELGAAAQARSRIDVAQLSPQSQKLVILFDQFAPIWEALLGNLAIAPQLLGADGPRIYLLLMQNDDELRATGGFITAVALLQVRQGQITLSNFEDSGEINGEMALHLPPPKALEKFMFAPVWVLRDANWSPDFPTVANITQGMYRVDRRISMDGVIAVNLGMLPKLVDIWGPIALEGQSAPVNPRNVISMLESFKGQTFDGGHRKAVLLNLLQEIVRRISTGDFDRARLARVVYESMIAKDLLISVNDITLNRQLPAWQSGALYTGTGDALMIVDSNVGWNKVDRSIERRAEYQVTIKESGQADATVTIAYTNLSPAAMDTCLHRPKFGAAYEELQQACYYDYVRIVAPAGSQLVAQSETLETTTEDPVEGRAVFGGYLVVPRGESRTIRFEYALPPIFVSNAGYVLRLEKQPGALPLPARVRIMLPANQHLRAARPLPVIFQDHLVEFDLTLDHDQTIVLDLSPSQPSAGVLILAGFALAALLLGFLNMRRRKIARRL